MSTNFAGVTDLTLQKLCDKLLTCVRTNSGSAPAAAPNAFKDRNGDVLTTRTGEVEIVFRTNPDGTSATLKVIPIGDVASSFEGTVDVTTLAAILV